MMEYQRQPAGYQAYQRSPIAGGHYPAAYSQQPQQFAHSRNRTSSSSVLPAVTPSSTYSNLNQSSPTYNPNNDPSRRLSTATTSTTSTGGQMGRSGTNNSSNIRRSTSSRSSSSPTSYVALMRKQKATVWCDRSQHEDPRVAAAHRAAKQRATLEVHGSNARSSTLGSSNYSGKIRHGGKVVYLPANMSGAGLPVRLSANEIGTNEDEDDAESARNYNRTGSGRSSLNSNRYPSGYPRPQNGRFSTGSTPPNGGEGGSPDISEMDETPVASNTKSGYFSKGSGGQGGSGGSGTPEREDSFGDIKELSGPSAILKAADNAKKAEELRRRGSVDDRTMTMSGVRLFVANPDLSD